MTAKRGLFYGLFKMATDVEVQYFSHLNGLTLGNNWGDLIRMLDKALVTGIDFTQITAASIDEQGDVHITLYSPHNAMLFQIVELLGFTPTTLNQKYRIKGVPSENELILKPTVDIAERSITIVGTGKLASLGYEIIFRDANDVKRVYRAKNPTSQHPFIRVDESLSSPDGATGVYSSSYAKYAMVGLLEHMDHIDDYENPTVLQLPFDPNSLTKNWSITGTGSTCARGWSRWYWAKSGAAIYNGNSDSSQPEGGNREFLLCGNYDAFYINLSQTVTNKEFKSLYGCGLLDSFNDNSVILNWFLMSHVSTNNAANSGVLTSMIGGTPLTRTGNIANKFIAPKYSPLVKLSENTQVSAICPDEFTGYSGIYSGGVVGALEIPTVDSERMLRGCLRHLYYAGNAITLEASPVISEKSLYVSSRLAVFNGNTVNRGGVYFYLGDLQ